MNNPFSGFRGQNSNLLQNIWDMARSSLGAQSLDNRSNKR